MTERFRLINRKSSDKKSLDNEGTVQHFAQHGVYFSLPASGINRRVESISHSEGRFFNVIAGTTPPIYRAEYTMKDHLGNARVTFTDINSNGKIDVTNSASTNEIIQENHYYAFGMAHGGPWLMNNSAKDNFYMYNSKEYNNDHALNWSDYGARWYDAAIGRWGSVDPLAEKFVGYSPYNYVLNNPLKFIDPDGMDVWDDVAKLQQQIKENKQSESNSIQSNQWVNSSRPGEGNFTTTNSNTQNETETSIASANSRSSSDGDIANQEGENPKDKMKGGKQKERDKNLKGGKYPKEFTDWLHRDYKPKVSPGKDFPKESLPGIHKEWEDYGKPVVKTVGYVVIGIAIWEISKWTVATIAAPATFGGSLAVAAVIP